MRERWRFAVGVLALCVAIAVVRAVFVGGYGHQALTHPPGAVSGF